MAAAQNSTNHAYHLDDSIEPADIAKPPTTVTAADPAAHQRSSHAALGLLREKTSPVITRAEFAGLLTTLGKPATTADAAFAALDHDHDHRITHAEYVAAWEAYLLNDTPDPVRTLAFTDL